jgi:hypothetical protein
MPSVIVPSSDARLDRRTGSPEGLARRVAELERQIGALTSKQMGGMARLNNLVQFWDDSYRMVIHGPYLPMYSIPSIASGSYVDLTFTHNLNIPNGHYIPIGTFAGGNASDRAQPPSQQSRDANQVTCRFANSWGGAIGPFTWDGVLVARYPV